MSPALNEIKQQIDEQIIDNIIKIGMNRIEPDQPMHVGNNIAGQIPENFNKGHAHEKPKPHHKRHHHHKTKHSGGPMYK